VILRAGRFVDYFAPNLQRNAALAPFAHLSGCSSVCSRKTGFGGVGCELGRWTGSGFGAGG
jgi:hypothetical protein